MAFWSQWACYEMEWGQRSTYQVWRDGPEVKSTGYSSRGPRFMSQHPLHGSQLSVIKVVRDLMPPSGFHGHCMHVVHQYIHS